ncbi:unnamed protein product [Pleuronectes platessa]|uniref:Uncharacterized protein n=1 Tax=Pleuronectes platessa TaxID=8262 RepID=A0A9N7U6A4_PLEPL|nr:unnamed protein product [Pleuronectes platessa]
MALVLKLARQKWELVRKKGREGGGKCGGKEVEWGSSLKSTGVGRSPPELGYAGELRVPVPYRPQIQGHSCGHIIMDCDLWIVSEIVVADPYYCQLLQPLHHPSIRL